MKAIEYRQYGAPEVLSLTDVPKPTPGDREVLIKVRATTVTHAETMMRRGDTLQSRLVLGLRRPRRRFRIMGLEIAGEVELIGRKVTRFRPGQRVFGFTGFSLGGHAEYCCLDERASLAVIPENLSYEEAAATVDGATTALYFLQRKARLAQGERVLVIGASGSVGTAAVQIARHLGATVTGVCSGANRELVESLGAHEVIDYTKQDYSASGQSWDIIFDTVNRSSFAQARRALTEGGRYLPTVGGPWRFFLTLWTGWFYRRKMVFGMSVNKTTELKQLVPMLAEGALRPVIDRSYPLPQIARAAHYVDQGHKRGNVVLQVG
jgi:NADPH:quinone reductase-like Zn-dependent oxidoreductase